MGVYTDLKIEEQKYIENIYNIQIKELKFISTGILNSNFLVLTKDDRKYILRIFEAKRSLEEEEKELKLVEEIADFIPVAKAIKDKNSVMITEFNQKKIALFNYIDGETLVNINQVYLREIATYLGKFHRYSENIKANMFTRRTRIDLDFYIEELKKENINFENSEKIYALYEEIKSKNTDFDSLPKGIIHSDIFPDNIIIKNNHINGIIDFNEAYYAPYIYDIAIIINFWVKVQKFDFQKEYDMVRDFLNTYSRYRKITKNEINLLDLACKKMALTFLTLRLYKEKIEKTYQKAIEIEEKKYSSLIDLLNR